MRISSCACNLCCNKSLQCIGTLGLSTTRLGYRIECVYPTASLVYRWRGRCIQGLAVSVRSINFNIYILTVVDANRYVDVPSRRAVVVRRPCSFNALLVGNQSRRPALCTDGGDWGPFFVACPCCMLLAVCLLSACFVLACCR